MFNSFKYLMDDYISMAGEFPIWVSAAAIIIHLIAVIACWKVSNAGTISRIFWICVILMFPFAGIVAFLLLSILPAALIKKRDPRFMIRSMPEKAAIWGVIGAGAAGAIIGRIYDSINASEDGSFFCLDLALLAWAISCVVDHYRSCRSDKYFIRVGVRENEENFVTEPAGEIFGVRHLREKNICSDSERALESRLVRNAIPEGMLTIGSPEPASGTFEGKEYCAKCYTDTEFNYGGSAIDAIDAKYLGGGVTRYTVSVSENTGSDEEPEKVIVDRNLYRYRYPMSSMLMRCVSVLALAVTLFSPLFGKFSTAIAVFLSDKLSRFL